MWLHAAVIHLAPQNKSTVSPEKNCLLWVHLDSVPHFCWGIHSLYAHIMARYLGCTIKKPEGQVTRWLEKLQEYNFEIVQQGFNADALSKLL